MQERLEIPPAIRSDTRDGVAAEGSRGEGSDERSAAVTVKRVALAAATAFLSINLWTGSPVLALWVGSEAADERALSMTPLFVVVVTLLVVTLLISAALLWLEVRYRILADLPPREARLTWLRPFNAQREPVRQVATSLPERIVTLVVYLAVVLLLVWFVFFAGSPLGDYAQYA
ncbi:MAG TPA: hypothetical protein VLZ06_08025 [Solirubrobacteraceae bacterium]|nr:hypothetical protein [Solirubrobacteraceae bacterium]